MAIAGVITGGFGPSASIPNIVLMGFAPAAAIAPTMPANTTASVDENTTAVGTYAASSGTAPITYTLSGTDAVSFSIDSSTGFVSFLSAPDYETKASYSFDVVATNSADSDTQTVTVTINNVLEDAPTITTTGGTSITLTEGDTYSDPAWTWADDVVSGQSVTWSGAVDADTVGSYTRTATATNAIGTTTQDYSITVNAAPVITTGTTLTLKKVPSGELLKSATGIKIYSTTLLTDTGETDSAGRLIVPVSGSVGDEVRLVVATADDEVSGSIIATLEDIGGD
jgi:Bacterial surface protein, Ig-like domain/Cadherin domain